MDPQTLGVYDAGAEKFAKDWHAQPAPTDLHALVKRFFHPGGRTADVGCGSGREVAFLAAGGYDVIGYDASDALLEQARLRYPRLSFATAVLPNLSGVPDAAFDNVLCETVVMHLRRPQILDAVRRLLAILKTNGILYLSWRVTDGADQRDDHGRLYAAFESARGGRRLSRGAARRRAGQRILGQENPSHRGAQDRAITLSAAPPER
jgi:SAM-dependent methyltransferase